MIKSNSEETNGPAPKDNYLYLANAHCNGARRRFFKGALNAENVDGRSLTGENKPASDVEDPPFRGGDDVVAGLCDAYVTSPEPSPHLS
jgi:hypothetical protein